MRNYSEAFPAHLQNAFLFLPKHSAALVFFSSSRYNEAVAKQKIRLRGCL